MLIEEVVLVRLCPPDDRLEEADSDKDEGSDVALSDWLLRDMVDEPSPEPVEEVEERERLLSMVGVLESSDPEEIGEDPRMLEDVVPGRPTASDDRLEEADVVSSEPLL